MTDFDEVIDPELMEEALAEAMGQKIEEEILFPPLELLVKWEGKEVYKRIKVRYKPVSWGESLAYDHGDPLPRDVRRPTYDYYRTTDDLLEKMNGLGLKNIRIVNNIGKDGKEILDFPREKGDVLISKLGPGEFGRLRDAIFRPKSEDTDSKDSGSKARGKGSKGYRGRESSPALVE